jgi:hypothetical protein
MSPCLSGGSALDDGKGKAESSFVEQGKDKEKWNALGGGRRRNGVHNLKCNFGIRSDIAHAKTCRHAADDLAIGFVLDINRSELQYERHRWTSTTNYRDMLASLHNQSVLIASDLQRYFRSCIFRIDQEHCLLTLIRAIPSSQPNMYIHHGLEMSNYRLTTVSAAPDFDHL